MTGLKSTSAAKIARFTTYFSWLPKNRALQTIARNSLTLPEAPPGSGGKRLFTLVKRDTSKTVIAQTTNQERYDLVAGHIHTWVENRILNELRVDTSTKLLDSVTTVTHDIYVTETAKAPYNNPANPEVSGTTLREILNSQVDSLNRGHQLVNDWFAVESVEGTVSIELQGVYSQSGDEIVESPRNAISIVATPR